MILKEDYMRITFPIEKIKINSETKAILTVLLDSLPDDKELKIAQKIRDSISISIGSIDVSNTELYLKNLRQLLEKNLSKSREIKLPEIKITHDRYNNKIYNLYCLFLDTMFKSVFLPNFSQKLINSLLLIIEVLKRLLALIFSQQKLYEDCVLLESIDRFINKMSKNKILQGNKKLSDFVSLLQDERKEWLSHFFLLIKSLLFDEKTTFISLKCMEYSMRHYRIQRDKILSDNLLISSIEKLLCHSSWSFLKNKLLPGIRKINILSSHKEKIEKSLSFSEKKPDFELIKWLLFRNPELFFDKIHGSKKTVFDILLENKRYNDVAWYIKKFSHRINHDRIFDLVLHLLISSGNNRYLPYISYLNPKNSPFFSRKENHKKSCDVLIFYIGRANTPSEINSIMKIIFSDKNKHYFKFLYDFNCQNFLDCTDISFMQENWEAVKMAAKSNIDYTTSQIQSSRHVSQWEKVDNDKISKTPAVISLHPHLFSYSQDQTIFPKKKSYRIPKIKIRQNHPMQNNALTESTIRKHISSHYRSR
jgi:hypothetical protein